MNERAQQENVDLLKAFLNTCLQQRRQQTTQSPEQFRSTLIQLFVEAGEDELANLAIDVENIDAIEDKV